MKRLLAATMLLSLLLVGCTQEPAEITENTTTAPAVTETVPAQTTDTVIETTEAPVYSQQPMFAVSLPTVREYSASDDGTTIFRYSYQSMRLVMQDPDVADKIIIDFLNRVDEGSAPSEDIREQAEADSQSSAFHGPYLCDVLYSPTRIDEGVLSLFGTTVTYSGGTHPDYNCVAANYDLITGDVLTLGSILTHIDSVDSLCSLVVEKLDAVADEFYLMDNYQDIARQRFVGEESYDEDWYFTSTGLCFYFPPYEIAPYASGVITVEIPYGELTGIIDDAFFPPERDTTSGSVYAMRSADMDPNRFTQIAEVTIDQGGEQVFLYTDEAVQDVHIEVGAWDDTGSRFTAEYTVFATCALTPGDAVMIETNIADVMPNLRLTYRSGNEIVSVYISQSGEDGSILLISEGSMSIVGVEPK